MKDTGSQGPSRRERRRPSGLERLISMVGLLMSGLRQRAAALTVNAPRLRTSGSWAEQEHSWKHGSDDGRTAVIDFPGEDIPSIRIHYCYVQLAHGEYCYLEAVKHQPPYTVFYELIDPECSRPAELKTTMYDLLKQLVLGSRDYRDALSRLEAEQMRSGKASDYMACSATAAVYDLIDCDRDETGVIPEGAQMHDENKPRRWRKNKLRKPVILVGPGYSYNGKGRRLAGMRDADRVRVVGFGEDPRQDTFRTELERAGLDWLVTAAYGGEQIVAYATDDWTNAVSFQESTLVNHAMKCETGSAAIDKAKELASKYAE